MAHAGDVIDALNHPIRSGILPGRFVEPEREFTLLVGPGDGKRIGGIGPIPDVTTINNRNGFSFAIVEMEDKGTDLASIGSANDRCVQEV